MFFVFVLFFISNLSLCDILYIILSCIETVSYNYKVLDTCFLIILVLLYIFELQPSLYQMTFLFMAICSMTVRKK